MPLAALAAWLILVAVFQMVKDRQGADVSVCMFRNLTGLPCPTCGATRATQAMLSGHPVQAVLWNPLLVIGSGLLVIWLTACYFIGRPSTVRLPRPWRLLAWLAFGALFAANWAYLIVRGI